MAASASRGKLIVAAASDRGNTVHYVMSTGIPKRVESLKKISKYVCVRRLTPLPQFSSGVVA